VIGLGGLGHMGIKIAKALGAEVVVFSTSPSKAEDAKRLGAEDVIISTDKEQMKKYNPKTSFYSRHGISRPSYRSIPAIT
jgi:uncharacterized zinc-type alcohol dehydrogenase-like protein